MKFSKVHTRAALALLVLAAVSLAVSYISDERIEAAAGSGVEAAFTVPAARGPKASIPEQVSPWLNLKEGKAIGTTYRGPAPAARLLEAGALRPLSATSADINADGHHDLISGYGNADGRGAITLHRANKQAFEPTDENVLAGIRRGEFPVSFEKESTIIDLPIAPDMIATGRFTGDSPVDLLVASRTSTSIYILRSDGSGGFSEPKELNVGGEVTAITTGELNFTKGLIGVVLAVRTEGKYQIAVFDGGASILETQPRRLGLARQVRALALAATSGSAVDRDLYLLADGKLSVMSRIGGALTEPESIESAVDVVDFTIGEFIPDRQSKLEIALLSNSGHVLYLKNGDLDTTPLSDRESTASAAKSPRGLPRKDVENTRFAPDGWTVAESASSGLLRSGEVGSRTFLTKARITGNESDDLLLIDPLAKQIRVFFKEPSHGQNRSTFSTETQFHDIALASMPAVALPMRLNVMGQKGFIVLQEGQLEPANIMHAPNLTFNVTTTTDENNGCGSGAGCSLREAIIAANTAAGPDLITFGVNGTFQLTIAGNNENASATGDLDVLQALTITGNGPTNTVVTAGTSMANGIDKVFSINPLFNSAFDTSVTGLTIRYGRNISPINGDGYGGGLDWDAGFTSTNNGTLSLSNLLVDQNTSADGLGGGLGLVGGPNSMSTITNSTISSNQASRLGGSATNGGGIYVAFNSPTSMTTVTITGNSTPNTGSNGGGMFMVSMAGGGSNTLTGLTITNNNAGPGQSTGGGLYVNRGLVISPPTIISNNSAGREGGGMYMLVHQTSVNISEATFSNNNADGTGGAVFGGGAIALGPQSFGASLNALNVSYTRFIGNISPQGSGISNRGGLVNAENNWWGCNAGPGNTGCNTVFTVNDAGVPAGDLGSIDANPWLRFTHTASPSTIDVGQSSTLTASFLSNSSNQLIAGSNLDAFAGFTPTYNNAVRGNISAPQPFSNGISTATFTGTSGGAGSADASVNNSTVPANITVNAAAEATTTTITSDNPDPSVVGQTITVAYTVIVNPPGTGTPTGSVTVSDGINSCTGTVAAGSCNVALTTSGPRTLTATYAGNASFLTSSDTEPHQVNPANTTTTITAESADPTAQGEVFTVFYSVAVTAPGAGTPSGTVTVTDGNKSCMGTVAAGQCSLFLTIPGVRTLTATYNGNSNFNISVSAGEPHTVLPIVHNTRTTITSDDPDPSLVGASFPVTYTVSQTSGPGFDLSGTVTVTDGVDQCSSSMTPVAGGPPYTATGQCSLTLTTPGMRTLTATYVNTTGELPSSSDTEDHLVGQLCLDPPDDMVGWYTGDGTARDIAGGNDGTIAGDVTYVAGKVGQTFRLGGNGNASGTGDRVTVGNPASLRVQNFTIDAWIRRSDAGIVTNSPVSGVAGGTFFAYGAGGYGFLIDQATNRLALTKVGVSNVLAPTLPITDTNFHHVAVTKSGSQVIFYVDGVATAPATYSETFAFNTDAAIGARGDNDARNAFFGDIDELEIFDRALTAGEIQGIFAADSGGKCKPSDLSVTKTHAGDFTQGASGSYTVIVSNDGPKGTSGTTTVVDTMPAGLIPGAASGGGWSCNTAVQAVTCTSTAAIASAGSFPAITIPVTPTQNSALSLTNTATVSGGGEMDTSDDSASDPTTIVGVAQMPTVSDTATLEDTMTSSGLVISPNATDGAEVTHYRISSITNGTLYKNDGTTVITNGTFITAAEGAAGLKFLPSLNSTANGSFTVEASVGNTAGGITAGPATATITVTPVDDLPVAVNDAATVAEDSGVSSINVLANDTDIDGGPKSVSSVTQPVNGSVVITGGGTGLTYQPNANYCNTPPGTTLDTFTYALNGGSAATVTMTVTCVDDNPSAVNDTATVSEDSGPNPINVLGNDTDVDGGPKSVASVTQPANGSVVVTGGGTGLTYRRMPTTATALQGRPPTRSRTCCRRAAHPQRFL